MYINVNHLIFVASKFGRFKRLTYWRILILAVSILMPSKFKFYSHGSL